MVLNVCSNSLNIVECGGLTYFFFRLIVLFVCFNSTAKAFLRWTISRRSSTDLVLSFIFGIMKSAERWRDVWELVHYMVLLSVSRRMRSEGNSIFLAPTWDNEVRYFGGRREGGMFQLLYMESLYLCPEISAEHGGSRNIALHGSLYFLTFHEDEHNTEKYSCLFLCCSIFLLVFIYTYLISLFLFGAQ